MTEAARVLAQELQTRLGQGVCGPQAPLIAKIRNQYLMDIWVKIKKDTPQRLVASKEVIGEARRRLLLDKAFRQVRVVLDVDPA